MVVAVVATAAAEVTAETGFAPPRRRAILLSSSRINHVTNPIPATHLPRIFSLGSVV